MTLQSSGAITLANIQTEFGGANPISLNEYYAGGAYVPAGTVGYPGGTSTPIPSSGAISLNNFYGASAVTLEGMFIGGADFTANPTYGKLVQYRLDYATDTFTLLSQQLSSPTYSSRVGAAGTLAYIFGGYTDTGSGSSVLISTIGRFSFASKLNTVISASLDTSLIQRSAATSTTDIFLCSSDSYDGGASALSGYKLSRSTETLSATYTLTTGSYSGTMGVQSATNHYLLGGTTSGSKGSTSYNTVRRVDFATATHVILSATLAITGAGADGANDTNEGIIVFGGLSKGVTHKLTFSTETTSTIYTTVDGTYSAMSSGKKPRSASNFYYTAANDNVNLTVLATIYSGKTAFSTYARSILAATLPSAYGRIGAGSLYY